MPTQLTPFLVLGLLLYGLSVRAHAVLHPVKIDINNHNNQFVGGNISNYNEVVLLSEKRLIARQEYSAGYRKEMTPEQREHIKERRQRFESLPADEKQRLKDARKKFKQLSPQERKELRQKWRDLSPEERDTAIKKKRKKKS